MGGGAAGGLWRHQRPSWPPSWIISGILNREKWWFFVLCMINNTEISTLHDFSHKICFYYWKKLKNMYFHPKMTLPLATYDVISCDHSNWPSLDLSQNVREGWTNSYWTQQVLTFYPLGKNSEKPIGGWHSAPLVRPRDCPCKIEKLIHPSSFIKLNICVAKVQSIS